MNSRVFRIFVFLACFSVDASAPVDPATCVISRVLFIVNAQHSRERFPALDKNAQAQLRSRVKGALGRAELQMHSSRPIEEQIHGKSLLFEANVAASILKNQPEELVAFDVKVPNANPSSDREHFFQIDLETRCCIIEVSAQSKATEGRTEKARQLRRFLNRTHYASSALNPHHKPVILYAPNLYDTEIQSLMNDFPGRIWVVQDEPSLLALTQAHVH